MGQWKFSILGQTCVLISYRERTKSKPTRIWDGMISSMISVYCFFARVLRTHTLGTQEGESKTNSRALLGKVLAQILHFKAVAPVSNPTWGCFFI